LLASNWAIWNQAVLTLYSPSTRYDDLLEEENEAVQIALKRLSAKEAYERVYRIRRSVQCSYTHKLLPKDQWTKPEEVRLYFPPRYI
jgi:ubiquinol-cytochrome c reductase subunit 7